VTRAPAIAELLAAGAAQLARSDSPRLDAELLLCHLLDRPRSHLFAWPERSVPAAIAEQFRELLTRRAAGEPVAQLTGEREFWSLSLRVSADTLIPRPETELLVELALAEIRTGGGQSALDLGTGCGAIALALASECPHLAVTASDASDAALRVAADNAARHGLQLRLLCGDWYAAVPGERFALIVSNPPYIAAGDPDLDADALAYEPRAALIAADAGLADIATISRGAAEHLLPGGLLLVEHGWKQAAAVRELFTAAGLIAVRSTTDLAGRERATQGRSQSRSQGRSQGRSQSRSQGRNQGHSQATP